MPQDPLTLASFLGHTIIVKMMVFPIINCQGVRLVYVHTTIANGKQVIFSYVPLIFVYVTEGSSALIKRV